jgi:hypothetical protein
VARTASRRNLEAADQSAADREVPLEVGPAAREVAFEASGGPVATVIDRLEPGDLGRVGVLRRRALSPRTDLGEPTPRLALVDDDRVLGDNATTASTSRRPSAAK